MSDHAFPQTARLARVTGHVQGVSFRAWTEGRAKALGLEGWVRNEADGSVTALIAGSDSKVAEMIRALHDGPRYARVDSVETAAFAPEDVPPGFHVTG